MKAFLYDLNFWIKDSTDDELESLKICKLNFTFSIDILLYVNPSALTNVIKSFPFEYFTLRFKLKRKSDERVKLLEFSKSGASTDRSINVMSCM